MAALESSNIDMKDCELFSQFCVPVLLFSLAAQDGWGVGWGLQGCLCSPSDFSVFRVLHLYVEY